MTRSPAASSRSTTATPDPHWAQRWAAVRRRDPQADGQFVVAVRTTGIYCQPSSPTRLPRPENVEFFDTAAAAEAAGYRASQRALASASARNRHYQAIVEHACRTLASAEEAPRLEDLARGAGLSPHHFHRIFRSHTGLTPRRYAEAHRAQQLRVQLPASASVTAAAYAAGYGSSGRFYAGAKDALGMRPTDYRAGGRGSEIYFALGQCSLGAILVAQSRAGVCAIFLGDAPEPLLQDLQDRFPHAVLHGADGRFEAQVARVIGMIEAPGPATDLPLDIRGTAFQLRVWQALRSIPAGSTASYTQIARLIGAPHAVRAVAGACAANPLAVAIPCHRVVRTDGALSGYRWGVERKRELLRREARGDTGIPIPEDIPQRSTA